MKVFVLGGRAMRKGYVDLYFLIKNHFTLIEICEKAELLFSNVFNPALFRKQLCYFKDIDYSEEVEFMPGFKVSDKKVKDFLTNAALEGF